MGGGIKRVNVGGMICPPALNEIGLTDQPKTDGDGGERAPLPPRFLQPWSGQNCHQTCQSVIFFVLSRDLHCFESTVGNEKL